MGGGQSNQINNNDKNENNISNIPPVIPKSDPTSLAGMLFTKSTSSNKKPTSLEQALIGLDDIDDDDDDNNDPLFKTYNFKAKGNMFGNININKPNQNFSTIQQILFNRGIAEKDILHYINLSD